jgi:acetyl esterase
MHAGEVDAGKLRVRDAAALGIAAFIQLTADGQPAPRRRRGDQADDHVVRDQWLAALVLGDEREKAVFDLVPLARPRRQMTDSHRRVREIANGVGATVIFVDYVNAPEAKYPTQQEQAYASLLYTVEHADELRVDPTRLAIVGDSVGGHMAALITLMAKRRGGPNIRFQVLFYPVTDAISDNDSYRRFANGPWLTADSARFFFDQEGLTGSEADAWPLRASVQDLRRLPDALIIVDGDILRDEGEAYADKLMEAGVRVTSVRYNGTIHDFVMLNPLAGTPATRAAIQQAIDALKAALA